RSGAQFAPHAGVERGDIGADRLQCRLFLLDEQALRCPARKRLEPKRARACEQVGHGELFETAEPAREHREQCLARTVRGWARCLAPGRGEPAPAPFARDDSHEKAPSSLEEGVGGGGDASASRPAAGTTPAATRLAPPPLKRRGLMSSGLSSGSSEIA